MYQKLPVALHAAREQRCRRQVNPASEAGTDSLERSRTCAESARIDGAGTEAKHARPTQAGPELVLGYAECN